MTLTIDDILKIITALTPVVLAILAWQSNQAKQQSKANGVEIAAVKTDVAEVHKTVNSEHTALVAKFDDQAEQFNRLRGATDARDKTDAAAATFEAGRREGVAQPAEPIQAEIVNTEPIVVTQAETPERKANGDLRDMSKMDKGA